MKQQKEDSHLLRKVQNLDKGGTGAEYVANDNRLHWNAPLGSIPRLAIPRYLVPGILAHVHTTYDPLGVARSTELVQRKYHWTSLKSNV